MNFTKKSENDSMFNAYAYSIGAKHLLTEAEQAAEEAKQTTKQALESSEGQNAMTKIMQQMQKLLQTTYKKQYEEALVADGNKVGTKVQEVLNAIQNEITDQLKTQQANESYNLREAFLDRQVNKVKGLYQKGKDVMSGNVNNKSWKDEAILKRFESLKQSLSKELAELKADLGTTSNTDTTIKNAVNNAIAQITTDHGISSDMKGFQKFRHGAGKLVQLAGISTALGAPIAALAAPVAAAVGLTGAAATALTGGLTGGAVSMLKDLINGQKVDAKKAAKTGFLSALTAGLFKGVSDQFSGHDVATTSPTTGGGIETPHGQEAFKSMHGSEFNTDSNMDLRKFSTGETLKGYDIMGTSHDAAGNVINVQSPIVQNFTDTLGPKATKQVMDYINNMDSAQREEMFSMANRKSGKAIRELAKDRKSVV